MRGLSPDEVKELIEYIKQNNSWENLYKCLKQGRRVPKYYTICFDTRENDMWKIDFHQIIGDSYNIKDIVSFSTEAEYDLKTKIYEWLNEEKEKINE